MDKTLEDYWSFYNKLQSGERIISFICNLVLELLYFPRIGCEIIKFKFQRDGNQKILPKSKTRGDHPRGAQKLYLL